ncbi:unnamed protein product [Cuscuta campestris]|uniref:Uncharacterized protein n=1 Tax=Cuscuta campestris TaxID=132261 RepID=A0A484LF62_9ASTE|nr:unnamed protein product [Cuscuta campestris]
MSIVSLRSTRSTTEMTPNDHERDSHGLALALGLRSSEGSLIHFLSAVYLFYTTHFNIWYSRYYFPNSR